MAFSISGLTLTNGIQFSWPPAPPIIGSASLYGNTSANVSYTSTASASQVYSVNYSGTGSGNKLTLAHNSSFTIGTDFTIECWAYIPTFPIGTNTNYPIVHKGLASAATLEYGLNVFYNSGYFDQAACLSINYSANGTTVTATYNDTRRTFTSGAWHHVAFSRISGTNYIFVDGVYMYSTASPTFTNRSDSLYIGYGSNGNGTNVHSFYGYISNLRILNGTGLYNPGASPAGTTIFTPSTSALTAITNTVLLTCQSSTVVDNSANHFNITTTGATVSTTAPPTLTGYDVVSHTAISSPGNITGTLSQATSGTITVNNLSPGTDYTFTVVATNSEGNSDPSASSNQISTPATPPGQQAYTTAGTYTWVAPAGVTTVSAVVIGGGGSANAGGGYISGAGGGALAFKNNYTVTPGGSYTVVVGAGGAYNSGYGAAGGNSYFVSTSVCFAMGGQAAGGTRATYLGDGGGNGGLGTSTTTYSYGGNGGAGGYAGQGGDGGGTAHTAGYDGAGGGGGGGGIGPQYDWGMNGGGVGILGQGSNGLGGAAGANGSPGSGGTAYSYGGATGRNVQSQGAARLIWPGNTRSFPSTNTGDL